MKKIFIACLFVLMSVHAALAAPPVPSRSDRGTVLIHLTPGSIDAARYAEFKPSIAAEFQEKLRGAGFTVVVSDDALLSGSDLNKIADVYENSAKYLVTGRVDFKTEPGAVCEYKFLIEARLISLSSLSVLWAGRPDVTFRAPAEESERVSKMAAKHGTRMFANKVLQTLVKK